MWEPWETVACSFLPSLSTCGISLLKTSVTSSSPPSVPISSLSHRPSGTWSLMTWQCSRVKLSYLCYRASNATAWTGLLPAQPPRSLRELGDKACACLQCVTSVSLQLARCKLMIRAFDVYWLPYWFFQKPKVTSKNHVWKCLDVKLIDLLLGLWVVYNWLHKLRSLYCYSVWEFFALVMWK